MAVQATDAPTPARQAIDSLASWLRLAHTPGVSRLLAAQLLQHYQSPCAVLAAANARLAQPPADADSAPPGRSLPRFETDPQGEPCLSLAAARLLGGPLPPSLHALLEATLTWAEQPGNTVLCLDDPGYPPSLRQIADPPLLLYCKGQPQLLQREAVAVVGARHATAQGRANARQFARALSQAGLAVVSGLALGIDAAAHEGALEGPGGTVAVIGTGIDRIYPRRNAELARRLAEAGCVVSEFALGTHARPENFPIRNRIIAGMTRATVVVEAAARSGSLITAHAAVTAGRDVYVLPGSVQSPQSVGCHTLIREGARLVATPQQLLEDLGLPAAPDGAVLVDEAAGWLLDALGHDPVAADELAIRLQLAPAEAQASLLAVELAGVVERLPGGLFQRLKPA